MNTGIITSTNMNRSTFTGITNTIIRTNTATWRT
jgi:hypothetical protein